MAARLTALSLTTCLALAAAPPAADPGPDPEPRARDRRIEGLWAIERSYGSPSPGGIRFEFTRRERVFRDERGNKGDAAAYRLAPRKRPGEIDVYYDGRRKWRGIYKVEDGLLYLAWGELDGPRPTSFDDKAFAARVLERVKQ